MRPLYKETRWVRRRIYSLTSVFTMGKTYEVKEWESEERIVILADTGHCRTSDISFWEVDRYMENLEKHILN